MRSLSVDEAYGVLKKTLAALRKVDSAELSTITHSFALMLELMNACENAYRTSRIQRRMKPSGAGAPAASGAMPEAIVYVLTAHPTEARSPQSIELFHELQKELVLALQTDFESRRSRILHSLEVVWRLSLSRDRKPSVADEAESIYSIALREEVLSALLEFKARTCPVYLRSWVGGDKEGHPGVNADVMQSSLQHSREYLHRYVQRRLREVKATLDLLPKGRSGLTSVTSMKLLATLPAKLATLEKALSSLEKLDRNDGNRILRFRRLFRDFHPAYAAALGTEHPSLVQMASLLEMFPALVIPLELREASSLIMAENQDELDPKPFTGMLLRLHEIAGKANPKGYARGLVISLASSLKHIQAACELQEKIFGDAKIPVIPLFEQQDALEHATEVITQLTDRPKMRQLIAENWNGHLEMMVGYSDSAKEMGVLPSRLMISEAVQRLDRLCTEKKIAPLFFHGSGGSVDRGGGTLEEQTAWWPKSALNFYKATIQGEMVDRTLSTPEIAQNLLQKIAERGSAGLTEAELRAVRPPGSAQTLLHEFTEQVRAHYQSKTQSPAFMELVEKATAYRYLSDLRIGSRPARRVSPADAFSVSSLRAIPWVMCWTQTRILFPTWWGVGSAWRKLVDESSKAELKSLFLSDPLLSSYVKALGFTLAKVELPIWRLYLETSQLSEQQAYLAYLEFEKEYCDAVTFLQAITDSEDLLSFRPWLGESVRLRSPLIHPLNLVQMILLEREEGSQADSSEGALSTAGKASLIRETVTGISSGLMTTG